MLLAFFTDLRADRTPLLALSDKYQGPFGAIVDGDLLPVQQVGI